MNGLLLIATMLVSGYCLAQPTIPFDSTHWVFAGKVAKETFRGKACIRLTDGRITLKDSTFKNGVIEFDMTLSDDRYFPGIGFRVQDEANFEDVYLRPHQLGNPDAIQYTPVFNGQAAWQLYYGDGYSAAVTYPLNEWIHIRLAIRDTQAAVYINNASDPALVIHQLKRVPKPGRIILENGASVNARFAHFRYTKSNNPSLAGPFKPEPAPMPGTVMNWQISSTFDEKRLQTGYTLPQALSSQLTWRDLTAENSGKLNLSSVHTLREGHNTTFAKLSLISDKPQLTKLQLGFSDRAKVYVNGRLVYAGHDEFMSRDYRFLGTMGYFDEIYLDLQKGQNELWIAVSENFGGWGIQAMIADQTGLTIKP